MRKKNDRRAVSKSLTLVLSQTINIINVNLCMAVVLAEDHTPMPLSMTLALFQGHKGVFCWQVLNDPTEFKLCMLVTCIDIILKKMLLLEKNKNPLLFYMIMDKKDLFDLIWFVGNVSIYFREEVDAFLASSKP